MHKTQPSGVSEEVLSAKTRVPISVVIPTVGKRSRLLREALDSVRLQSTPPMEVIVVHNGSPEDLPRLTAEARLIQIPSRLGVAEARNTGAKYALGDYVSFLDDDDYWEASYLESIARTIADESPDMILGRILMSVREGYATYMDATNFLSTKHVFVFNPGATGSNTTVLREKFLMLRGYDASFPPSEDRELLLRYLLFSCRVSVQSNAVAIQRQHSGERLNSHQRSIVSTKRLLTVYGHQMTWRQRSYNRWRSSSLKVKQDKTMVSMLQYLSLSVWIIVIRMRPRNIWKPPIRAPKSH